MHTLVQGPIINRQTLISLEVPLPPPPRPDGPTSFSLMNICLKLTPHAIKLNYRKIENQMASPPGSNDINDPQNQAAAGAALALATTELEYRVELLNK